MKSFIATTVLVLQGMVRSDAAAIRVPRQVPNETGVTAPTTPAGDENKIIYVSVPSGVVLLLLALVVALLLGYIAWRFWSRRSRNRGRSGVVISDSFVLSNRVFTYPVQVQDTHEQQFQQYHGQNVFYNPTTARIEKVPDAVTSTFCSTCTSTNPSLSDSYSGHGFHPPPPTQATAPSALVCDKHVLPRDSFRSMPDELIHGNPRMAANMSKSLSCNEALNKSFAVTTYMNVGAGITMETTSTSNTSLCSCAFPVQEGRNPSPRFSLMRRSLRGSRRSVMSNTSQRSEMPEEMYNVIQYETPV